MNIQGWFPLGWIGWISLQSKELSRVFSNTTVQKHEYDVRCAIFINVLHRVEEVSFYLKFLVFLQWTGFGFCQMLFLHQWKWWFVGGRREALHPWQRSWGRRLNIHKGRIESQESPWKSSSIYPHNQSLPTLLLCALPYTSDFTGGCPPPPLSEKELT